MHDSKYLQTYMIRNLEVLPVNLEVSNGYKYT